MDGLLLMDASDETRMTVLSFREYAQEEEGVQKGPNEDPRGEKETSRAAAHKHLHRGGQGNPEQLAGSPPWILCATTTTTPTQRNSMDFRNANAKDGEKEGGMPIRHECDQRCL